MKHYIVDTKATKRVELPPEEGSEEGGWVDLRRLSARDIREIDRACQRSGIALGSVSGSLLLLERAIIDWSLPLPTTRDKIRESLDKLDLELVNLLGAELTEDLPLTDEQREDLLQRRSGATALETEPA